MEKKIQKTLHLKKGDSFTYRIHRQSLDARRKPELFYVYTVDVTVSNENAVLKHCKGNIQKVEEKHYQIPSHGTEVLNARPVVIGSGPAGVFCAYLLALEGYRPLVLERGASVEERKKMWIVSGRPVCLTLLPMSSSVKAALVHFQMES